MKELRRTISFLCLIMLFQSVRAQHKLYDGSLKADSTYIKSYQDVFTGRFVIISKSNEFSIIEQTDQDNSNSNTLDYRPNDPLNIGLGFTYKWLGLNIAFKFPFLNNDEDIYGKTRRFDLSSHIYGRKVVADLHYQWYRGYYLANPQNLVPGWKPGDPHPTRSDIRVSSFGVGAYYIFNHDRFSYRAAFTFNERQKRSAGSAVLGGGFSTYRVRGDSSLVSGDYLIDLDSINVERARIRNFYSVGGYAHTFVIKHFYLSLTLGLGFGISGDKITLEQNKVVKDAGIGVVSLLRASVGYNSDQFYVGLSMFSNTFALSSRDNIGVIYSFRTVNIYLGYRFYELFKKKEPLPWLWDLKI